MTFYLRAEVYLYLSCFVENNIFKVSLRCKFGVDILCPVSYFAMPSTASLLNSWMFVGSSLSGSFYLSLSMSFSLSTMSLPFGCSVACSTVCWINIWRCSCEGNFAYFSFSVQFGRHSSFLSLSLLPSFLPPPSPSVSLRFILPHPAPLSPSSWDQICVKLNAKSHFSADGHFTPVRCLCICIAPVLHRHLLPPLLIRTELIL